MNRMKCGFYTYRGIAFCFVAAMFCGQTMAQVVEKRGFDSQKKINAFDNTTFCTAYLSDGALYTMRDIAINDVRKIERIVFNPPSAPMKNPPYQNHKEAKQQNLRRLKHHIFHIPAASSMRCSQRV